ncbi:MAG: hypothetical protein M3354_03120 [Chloroflexota bacterium]|nr:hypothetical protein [Chloroflexota bacterium]
MGQSSDQIRQEIDQHRSDAAQKIDDLETRVQDTATQARDQAKDMVEDTIQTVKESVDLRKQVEERPLVALGVAFVGGLVLGGITGGGGGGQQSSSAQGGSQQSQGAGGTLRGAAQRSGLEDTISNAAAALLGSVTEQFKSTLEQNFPGFTAKMDTAQDTKGGLAAKSRATQSAAGTTTTAA